MLLLHDTKRHFTSTITALTKSKTNTNSSIKTRLKPKANAINNIKSKFNATPTSNNNSRTKIAIGITKFTHIIKRFCKQGKLKQAVGILKNMDRQGIRADVSAYASLLQCCLETKAFDEGKKVHNHMIEKGFDLDLVLGTKLVVMYAKYGNLEDARKVFDEIPKRTAVSWTAMVAAYAKGKPQEALELFYEMQRSGVQPDKFTFASILLACARLGSLEEGKKVHKQIKRRGFERNVSVGSGLVDMYVKCGSVEDARKVFDIMPERNAVSWTAMVAGYARTGQLDKARKLFDKMPQRHVVSWNAMLGGNAEYGKIDEAVKLFDEILEQNVESAGYAQNRQLNKARKLFEKMPQRNVVSWNTMLGRNVEYGKIDKAVQLFDEIPEQNVESWNTMIAAYLQSGNVEKATECFEKMVNKDLVSWNTIISGYAQNWCFNEALDMYGRMKQAGVKPNSTTFASVLPACANSAAIQQGKWIHKDVIRSGFEFNSSLGSALVDMYAKFGCIDYARKMFDKMPERTVVSWTAMIGGYAINGYSKEALQLFKEMQQSSIKPNHNTFAGVLAGCHCTGLVDEGREYFDSMCGDYNIEPELGHYCYRVDLLGHAGCLNEAQDFIKKMAVEADVDILASLLRTCSVHNNIKLEKRVVKHLLEIDPNNFSHYVMVLNMYASGGRLDDKEKVRELMREGQVKKMSGRSWIEINKKVYSFGTGD